LLVLAGGSQRTEGAVGEGGGAANHEFPNPESVDRHSLFYISKKGLSTKPFWI